MSIGRITVRVDESLHERLGSVAEAAGKSESQVVREALENYLDRQEEGGATAFDLCKKAGMIGCIKGGPKDMSSNPKHLEGFGRD
jgi:metal-responsive CopG/Arc/MetJ family transcriptional regulator